MSPVYQTERVGQMDQCLSRELFKEVIRPDRTEDVDFKKWYELRRKLSRKKRILGLPYEGRSGWLYPGKSEK